MYFSALAGQKTEVLLHKQMFLFLFLVISIKSGESLQHLLHHKTHTHANLQAGLHESHTRTRKTHTDIRRTTDSEGLKAGVKPKLTQPPESCFIRHVSGPG